ncbi:MAG: group 1 truncated hemoglobin [Pseudomonadales bacterium]|nr:group 1 truncated hemoglobin [Pseudomonadales bacterium]
MSLYESLGGEPAVDAAVELFYKKILADERVCDFFNGINMARQKRMQKAFLTVAFGGPNHYTGSGLRKAHKRAVDFGLNDSHFDAVIEDLRATLMELGVPTDKVREATAIAETTRNDVLCR